MRLRVKPAMTKHEQGGSGIILAHGGRAVVSPYPPVRRVVRVKKL